jgi:DNA-binding PadR family transcriptional regulator
MPKPKRSNPLALAVLTCLYERPMHPYEVAHTLRTRAKHESIRLNYGSLYNVVESLQKQGFIRERETVREGRRPPRTVYEITETGTAELADWLSELLTTPVKEFTQFEAGISLMPALPPDEVAQLLAERRSALDQRLTHVRSGLATARAVGLPRLFALEDEYEERMLVAEAEFVDGLVKEIEAGTLEGMEEWRSWFAGDGAPVFTSPELHVRDDAEEAP